MTNHYVRSPADDRDWVFENLCSSPTEISSVWAEPTLNYSCYGEPIRDQGNRGTCAAFAGAAIREMYDNIKNGRQPGVSAKYRDEVSADGSNWLSPEFIYYHRDVRPVGGMYGRNVFKVLQKIGTVPEELFPYKISRDIEPSAELRGLAMQYRIRNYARVETVDGLKQALVKLGPCYMSLPLYCRKELYWWRKTLADIPNTLADITVETLLESPRSSETRSSTGHAVVVVGYNSDGFILRNSWGPEWNGDGHVVLPYSDWPLVWECWVPIVDVQSPIIRRNKMGFETGPAHEAKPVHETISPASPRPGRIRRWLLSCVGAIQRCLAAE